jgi:Na+/proline symporter
MSTTATYLVSVAVLLPGLLYVFLAIKQRKNIRSLHDFFPLTKFIPGDEYGRSTAAAGMSLATVIITILNLAPSLGLGLLVTIASYAASFLLLYVCAPTILRANPANDTVQAFLGKTYGSIRVRNVALLFCFIGYISIFAMELIVGVTVLEPFFGDGILVFSLIYLVFLVLYSVIAGFRAIVATEQWQIRFIAVAVLSLVALIPLFWPSPAANASFMDVTTKVLASSITPWAFALGIITMNLPATISDAGTWQRLCATTSEREARRGLLKAIWMFILLWGTLIVAGSYIAQLGVVDGQFKSAQQPLITYIVERLATNDALHLILLFIFVLGLFAAMITTADSLLLVAAQMYAIDFANLDACSMSESEKINKARVALAFIAASAFVVFAIFKLIKFDVVQLVFAIYGAQLALFPTVAAALFLNKWFETRRAVGAAVLSIGGGFIAAWASALYGKFSGEMNWLYNAPVAALMVSFGLLLILSPRSWGRR